MGLRDSIYNYNFEKLIQLNKIIAPDVDRVMVIDIGIGESM